MDFFRKNNHTDLKYSFAIDTGVPGPSIVLLGAVHGNEPVGVEVIRKLYQTHTTDSVIKRGKIYCILANPEAYLQNQRYIEENLNRAFLGSPSNTLEGRRVAELRQFFEQTKIDFLLDFHSISLAGWLGLCVDKFLPQIDQTRKSLQLRLDKFWISSFASPGGIHSEAARHGFQMVFVECGQHEDPGAADFGWSILNKVLKHFQMITKDLPETKPLPERVFNYEYDPFYSISGTEGFEWVLPNLYTGLKLKEGQLYAKDTDTEYRAPKDCFLVMPDPKPRVGDQGVAYLCEAEKVTL